MCEHRQAHRPRLPVVTTPLFLILLPCRSKRLQANKPSCVATMPALFRFYRRLGRLYPDIFDIVVVAVFILQSVDNVACLTLQIADSLIVLIHKRVHRAFHPSVVTAGIFAEVKRCLCRKLNFLAKPVVEMESNVDIVAVGVTVVATGAIEEDDADARDFLGE